EKVSPGLLNWASRTDRPDPARLRVPSTALMVATGHVDFGALFDGLAALVPADGRAKWDNMTIALDGLLLGRDVRTSIAPRLGAGLPVYYERPETDGRGAGLPAVVQAQVGRDADGVQAAGAVDNALRTMLAVYALDDQHGGGKLRFESRPADGATVTALSP